MPVKVAVNGFGRIGRSFFRVASTHPEIEIVAVNDLADGETLAHLLKYDSVQGTFAAQVEFADSRLLVGGRPVRMLREEDPAELPWSELEVDIVIESTGRFTDGKEAEKHLGAGAAKVIVSAPGQGVDLTLCIGINEKEYLPDFHHVLSNASCTTNCLAPVAKVILENFGIVKGMLNTVHSYNNGQAILDLPHADLRRGRAAGLSMIPTTTGAAKAAALVLPELEGKLEGMAVRVPVPNVSLIDLVVETERETTVAEVNSALRKAAEGHLEGILEYCELPLVSKDYTGNPASSVVDALSTTVVGGNMVRVIAWYDNEWGYASRLVGLVEYVSAAQAAAGKSRGGREAA